MKKGETKYSEKIPGDPSNYQQAVRFDSTNGYIGISQVTDRVLLSPAQLCALLAFVRPRGRRAVEPSARTRGAR